MSTIDGRQRRERQHRPDIEHHEWKARARKSRECTEVFQLRREFCRVDRQATWILSCRSHCSMESDQIKTMILPLQNVEREKKFESRSRSASMPTKGPAHLGSFTQSPTLCWFCPICLAYFVRWISDHHSTLFRLPGS